MEPDKIMSTMGEEVVDYVGRRIGKVTGFALETSIYTPEWLVVKPPLFRRQRLVPLDGAVQQGDTIRVLFSKERFLSAPVPTIIAALSEGECAALTEHYHRAA